MKQNNNYLLAVLCSLLFVPVAHAAGTYYTGSYQSPQQRYYNGYNTTTESDEATTNQDAVVDNSGYYNDYYNSRYQRQYQQPQYQQVQPQYSYQQQNQARVSDVKQGFYLGAGISREDANWKFDMKDSGSILHYDNISWNVFDANAGYNFYISNTPVKIDTGIKIGMQSGETTMIDDDITNGGYFITQWVDTGTGDIIGDQIGHALSVGTSSEGGMFGFHAGFGLPELFKIGNAKFTPSVGYRNLNYNLKTKNNYGLSVDTSACFRVGATGELQCDPAVVVYYNDDTKQIIWRDNITGDMNLGTDADIINTGGTYYYQQPGTSHSYDVTWSGPYAALDIDYDINQNNSVNTRLELGLPSYDAVGNQPYRFDWEHPKSVEDSAGMGSATHLGLAANWKTSITNSVMLSFGLTYDYYSVSGADAKTYLNSSYYLGLYDAILESWQTAGKTEAEMLATDGTGDQTAINIKNMESNCPGWVCSVSNEVGSLYKSMGIRIGLNAKF